MTDGADDSDVSMQPAHVDAALSTAHARLTYQYGPVWQGDYWTLMWEGLTGRWEDIRAHDDQSADDPEQTTLVADGGEEVGRAIEQITGTLYTVDGSGTDTLHLTLECPHVDARLVHGDYDVSSDGPRPIDTENVSERFLAESSLCGTCERLYPEEVNARVA